MERVGIILAVTLELAIFLFLAATVGGALNAVAGGGSFLTLPALIYAGVSPVAANATSAMALWPGSLSAAWAYRRELAPGARWIRRLLIVSLVGGLFGARLLVGTSDAWFLRILPWLMLLASLTLMFGGRLARSDGGAGDTGLRASPAAQPRVWSTLIQLLIATYGGYFGGGMGIMTLAVLAAAGMTDMHAMNGLKLLLAVAINGVALAQFVVAGTVAWAPGLVMVVGAVAGGYGGASLARRVDGRHVRTFVTVVAWLMTTYFFLREP